MTTTHASLVAHAADRRTLTRRHFIGTCVAAAAASVCAPMAFAQAASGGAGLAP